MCLSAAMLAVVESFMFRGLIADEDVRAVDTGLTVAAAIVQETSCFSWQAGQTGCMCIAARVMGSVDGLREVAWLIHHDIVYHRLTPTVQAPPRGYFGRVVQSGTGIFSTVGRRRALPGSWGWLGRVHLRGSGTALAVVFVGHSAEPAAAGAVVELGTLPRRRPDEACAPCRVKRRENHQCC